MANQSSPGSDLAKNLTEAAARYATARVASSASNLGSKITSRLSLQVSPTLLHRNFVPGGDVNEVFAIGMGGRFKLSKRVALPISPGLSTKLRSCWLW